MKKIIFIVITAVLLTCSESYIKSIKVNRFGYMVDLPMDYAKESGYLKENGLDIDIKTTGSGLEALDMLINKDLDIISISSYIFINHLFKNSKPEIVILGSYINSYSAIKLLTISDDIKTVNDIRGKRVALQKGTQFHYFFEQLLIYLKIPSEDIIIIDSYLLDQAQMLKNEEVDIIINIQTNIDKIEDGVEGKIKIVKVDSFYQANMIIVTTREYLNNNRSSVKNYLKSIGESCIDITYADKKTNKIIDRISKTQSYDIPLENIEAEFNLNLKKTLLLTLDNQYSWLKKSHNVEDDNNYNYLDLIDTEILKSIYPNSVTIGDK